MPAPADPADLADLLLHPVRLRIVQTLLDQPMTPLQLVEALGDVPQATAYRAVNALADGGVLAVVDEEAVRGGVQRTYAVVEDAVTIGADQVAELDAEGHVRHFLTFLGTMLAGFSRAVGQSAADGQPVDAQALGIGYRMAPLWLDDDELAALIAELAEVITCARASGPGDGRRRRLLYTVIHPDGPAAGARTD